MSFDSTILTDPVKIQALVASGAISIEALKIWVQAARPILEALNKMSETEVYESEGGESWPTSIGPQDSGAILKWQPKTKKLDHGQLAFFSEKLTTAIRTESWIEGAATMFQLMMMAAGGA